VATSSVALASATFLAFLCLLGGAGCGAVYPELASPVRPAPEDKELEPKPPESLRYIVFESAEIPERTRDGRRWDRYGGSAPDPFAKVLLNDKELILTPVQSNSVAPTWPDQKRANYEIAKGAKFEVQLWDSNPIHHHPICIKVIKDLHEEVTQGTLNVECASGARLRLTIAPARAKLGLGIYYELRTSDVGITRVIRHSPAARAGLAAGDQVLQIQGRPVKNMDDGEVRSLINAHSRTGLVLQVRREDGRQESVRLKEGAMYPSVDEGIPL
jgi:hypothetical protein